MFLLWLGAVQAFVALWARVGHENGRHTRANVLYDPVDTHSDSGFSDAELGGIPPPPVLSNGYTAYNGYDYAKDLPNPSRSATPDLGNSSSYSCCSDGVPVDAASLASVAAQVAGGPLSKERLAQIAAGMS